MGPEDTPTLTAEQIVAYGARKTAIAVASAVPLPGPLLDAFAGEPVVVFGFTLLPLTAGHIALLQRLDSPLIRAIKRMAVQKISEELASPNFTEANKGNEGLSSRPPDEFGAEELIETFYVMTLPPPELRALLAKGRQVFRETALATVADKLSPAQLAELPGACGLHFARSFATAVQYEAPRPDKETFTRPPAPQMASAGGSIS